MTKKENLEPIKFGYEIEVDSFTETTREQDSTDSWDRGDSDTYHTFLGVRRSDTPEIASSLDISVGTECYVVWAIWSTGDSFGHDSGSQKNLLGVFLDENSALALEKEIERNDRENPNSFSFFFTTPDKQEITVHQSWHGYFDSLDSVRVEKAVMQ
jgi:hypothetical protein